MMRKIGNVCLDETYYPGEDYYSDGAVEERILKLTEEYGESDYHKIIVKERDWAVMYHLAHERGNILSWYPFQKGAKILEVGSGCGAVTGALAAHAGSLTCIDLSKRRSEINAMRNRERDNIKICVGNFQDIEKGLEKDFDYATLIGVFEYAQGYIGGENPYHEFLTAVMEHIKPGGKLLLAIENKFGLKYWAGCTEDHVGRMFEGIEGYPSADGVRTFTKPELIRILEECGCTDYNFYYPHPDYKLPLTIYSDHRLPQKGGLAGNFCNFDRSRLALMDEGRAFDEIIENGLFDLYANSFFVEIRKTPVRNSLAQVVYAKYSNGRGPKFAIQTHISEKTSGISSTDNAGGKLNGKASGISSTDNAKGEFGGNIQIYKKAEYEEGRPHIRHIAQAAKKLQALWAEKGIFQVNRCRLEEDKIYFEYLPGVTLEETLDQLLEQKKLEQVMDKIQKAVDSIRSAAPLAEFQAAPEFQQVFGEVELPAGTQAVEAADIDMIFSNLLPDGEGKYHVLDYEWTFFFPVPVGFIVYRALHYYLEGAFGRRILGDYVNEYAKLHPKAGYEGGTPQETVNDLGGFYEYFGVSRKMQRIYTEMEQNFQKYISGGYASVFDLYNIMGKAAFPLRGIMQEAERRRMQVYLDAGRGFSEENSYFIDQIFQDHMCCKISLPKGTRGVSIDPAFSACIIRDIQLKWEDGGAAPYVTTGLEIGDNCYLFDNIDPKIIVGEIPQERRQIEVSYKISILEGKTADLLMDKLSGKGKIKDRVRKLIKG
ncbi:MAG: class I SAM-dependent methyltransferase [Lachnospiraceae bacterium]|nr:class I SAM-dependent methyltransferase [Lachnospiraceae bacterium]